MKPITIVTGGQYGSEAKGAIASYLCNKRNINYVVRTGATNAGHSVVYKGKKYAMQQLPTGWTNPNTIMVIGAGALVDLEILNREINMIEEATGEDPCDRIMIDYRAGLHFPSHRQKSTESGRHYAIGATGKGCSEALIDRIRGRGSGYVQLGKWLQDSTIANVGNICDTEELLNEAVDKGASILLEGTQGMALDLYLGPYPYVTHKQTGPAQWMLEAGLSPGLLTDIVMVVRTYPIRVAGNSGPLPQETSWPTLARDINNKRARCGLMPSIVSEESIVAFEHALMEVNTGESNPNQQHIWQDRVKNAVGLSELNARAWATLNGMVQDDLKRLFEMTTVTKKLRRVGRLDYTTLSRLSRQTRPNSVCLTFMNYEYPERWHDEKNSALTKEMGEYLNGIELVCKTKVNLVSWGPNEEHIQEV